MRRELPPILLAALLALLFVAAAPLSAQWTRRPYPASRAGGNYMSDEEKKRVFAEFDAARAVYRRLQAEAPALTNGRP